MLANEPDRVCYGFKHVSFAADQSAVEDLLISDKFYRCDDFELRNQYVSLMESIQINGGKVLKFSSLHASGEQLNLYTGIAAVLRFPIPELETLIDEEVVSSAEAHQPAVASNPNLASSPRERSGKK